MRHAFYVLAIAALSAVTLFDSTVTASVVSQWF